MATRLPKICLKLDQKNETRRKAVCSVFTLWERVPTPMYGTMWGLTGCTGRHEGKTSQFQSVD